VLVVLGMLAALGLGVVLWRIRRAVVSLERQMAEFRLLRREVEELRGTVERGLAVTRTHLAGVAAGDPPARETILHGLAYQAIQPAPALMLYEQTPDLFVLDVRTEAEWANGHIPKAHLIPVDELEDRLSELPPRDTLILVHCASGGRSTAACETLGQHGFTRLLNLAGGMHGWQGPTTREATLPPPAATKSGTDISYRGGPVTGEQVVAAIRECFDPEIPLNIYDLGLVYGIDIDDSAIAVKMTLTSEACPSARSIPQDVQRRIAALGQPNVTVDVIFDPPWHPSRISPDGKQKLGLE
jgi:metal-sulfur cluster biosynthetic enzyme/rhodanese-related sulfurtransferase